MPLGVLLDERLVARLLHPLADLVEGLVPGDVLPVIGAGPADLRLDEPPRVQDVLLERGALGAEGAAVDRMVRVALDVDHLRGDVLRLVAQRVDEHAAADGAVRAGRAGFSGAGDLQLAQLCVGGSQVEAEDRGGRPSNRADFEEVPAGESHPSTSLTRRAVKRSRDEADRAGADLGRTGPEARLPLQGSIFASITEAWAWEDPDRWYSGSSAAIVGRLAVLQ